MYFCFDLLLLLLLLLFCVCVCDLKTKKGFFFGGGGWCGVLFVCLFVFRNENYHLIHLA